MTLPTLAHNFSSSSVMCASFLEYLDACAAAKRCSLIQGATVIRCINIVSGTPSSSIMKVCFCTFMSRKGPVLCGCSSMKLKIAILSDVLALPFSGRLSRNTHWLATNYASTGTLKWLCRLYCTPHIFHWALSSSCCASTIRWRFHLIQYGSVSTLLLGFYAVGWEGYVCADRCRNYKRLKGFMFLDLCPCALYAYVIDLVVVWLRYNCTVWSAQSF